MVLAIGLDGLAKSVLPSLLDLEKTMAIFGKWPWQLGVLLVGVGPGLGEELWCRGFLGRGLVGRYGIVVGILLTSLLFGAIHLEPRQAVTAMAIGIALHLTYLATRSLLVPIMLHMANNSLGILTMHNPALASLDIPAQQIPWHVYFAAALLVATVAVAFYKSRAMLVDDPSSSAPPWDPSFPGVELPPSDSSTRVDSRGPDWISWILAVSCLTILVVAIIPTAKEAANKAPPRPVHKKV